jgi:NTE family protein
MTVTSVVESLRGVPLFGSLDPDVLSAVAAASDLQVVPARAVLFDAGAPADAMYVVVTGRFDVVGSDGTLLRSVGPGAVVGELALLAGGRRSATVRAVRDSRVVRVGRDGFLAVTARAPEAVLGLAAAVAAELRSVAGGDVVVPRTRPLGVTAIVTWDGAGATAADRITRQLGDVVVLDGSGDAGAAAAAAAVESAEAAGRGVVLRAGGDDADGATDWAAFVRRTADRIVAVGTGPPPQQVAGEAEWSLVAVVATPGHRPPWPSWASGPWRRAWVDDDASLARLARRLRGASPGGLLSGGGARGLAHIGVIAELERGGRRPDRWGGASMGAFVGALAAAGRTATEIEAVCRAEFVGRRPFRDYAPVPRHALLRARRAQQMLERLFGDLRVEDLRDDYFCVSADLVAGELVVHRSGRLVEVVGASMSIPGLAPPVRRDGTWLVDGGVLDNLPVDVMVAAQEGPVVAVDVMRTSAMAGDAAMPRLMDTIGQALTIGGRQLLAANRAAADVLLTPRLGSMGLFDFDRMGVAVAAGRQAVRDNGDGGEAVWGASGAGAHSAS